jgi:2-phospho-L-lactate guanylyltransferase
MRDAMVRNRIPPLQVIVPMKPLDQAKSRLWTDMPSLQREGVILMMMDRVVRSAIDAMGPESCRVVGGDPFVRQVAIAAGAVCMDDPGHDLNSSLWLSMLAAYDEGSLATLFLPGDLPGVSADDILAIARASEEYTRPVGVRAANDGGTNALLVPARCVFAPLLGEDSFAKHSGAAERQGEPLVALELSGLAVDMDTYDDLQWAKANVAGFTERISDWQAWLNERKG